MVGAFLSEGQLVDLQPLPRCPEHQPSPLPTNLDDGMPLSGARRSVVR